MTEVRCDFCDLFCFGGILWTCGTFRPGNVSPVVIRCHPFCTGSTGSLPFPCLVAQGNIHISFWPLLAGFFGTFLGLLLAPYANRLSTTPKMCFLDLVSIHQTDQAGQWECR